jgi:ferritin-like metal-binding protein YciE
MGLLSKPIKNLDDLFVHTLQDIYYTEQKLTKALPKMVEKVSDPQLQSAFLTHLAETEVQIERVEQVFEMHGESAKATTCPAIDGIVLEAEEIMKDASDPEVLDAAALAAAQAVEHYEITRYGTLLAWAKQLGLSEAEALIQETLVEEENTDQLLSELAEDAINPAAA